MIFFFQKKSLKAILFIIVFPQAMTLYSTLMGEENYTVTLPMMLSEWHKLNNKSQQFGVLLETLPVKLGGAYWLNWMPDYSIQNITTTLQQRS